MRRKKLLKKSVGGFVTIEYTLLLAVLLVVYIFLISMALYQYNQCLLRTNIQLLGNKGARLAGMSAEKQINILQQREEELYYDKYFLAEAVYTDYWIRGSCIIIHGSGQMSNPLAAVGIGEEQWKLETECQVKVIHPAETLWLCKKLYGILQEETDINWNEIIGSERNAGSGVY